MLQMHLEILSRSNSVPQMNLIEVRGNALAVHDHVF